MSEKIKHAVEIYLFTDNELVFGSGEIVEQEFQDDGASETAAFDFEI